MKNTITLITLCIILMGISSCSQNFEVAAPYKPVMSVYAFLSYSTDTQYLRIEKGFLDNNRAAADMAKIADSIYWPSLEVSIKEFNGANQKDYITLQKLALDTTSYARETGIFADSPAYAYRCYKHVTGGNTYRLIIKNNTTGNTDSAEITAPYYAGVFSANEAFYNPGFHFHFPRPDTAAGYKLVANARDHCLFGQLRIHYVDKNTITQQTSQKYVTYQFPLSVVPDVKIEATITGDNLYNFLRINIKDAPANTERYLGTCDLSLFGGDSHLYSYLISNEQANRGLTGGMATALYCNIKGGDACVGVFATQSHLAHHNIPFDTATLQGFQQSDRTRGLNFKGFM